MSFDRDSAAAWMTRAATAVFGAALAIGIAPALQRRAAPGELPGALAAEGLSPSGPLLQFGVFLLFVVAFAIAGNFAARRLAGIRWATVSYCAALFSAPLPLMHFGNVRHVIVLGLVAIAIVLARNLQPRFSRDDVVLLPAFIACSFAFLDIGFGKTPVATFLRAAIAVFALRLIVGSLSKSPRPALAFAAAPLAFVFQMQWLSPIVSGVVSLTWIVGTALIGAMIGRERMIARALAFAIYPIALTAYPLALVGVNSPPLIDFFEDGHDFVVASEMLRGERPYADVLPTHGFLSDGGFDFLFMKSGAGTIGEVMRARRILAATNLAAMYFVALAATGSSAAGCLAVFLAFALFPASTFFVRSVPALLSLASFAAAMRLRSQRWLAIGGALLAVALLTSLDFAAYTAFVAIVVMIRSRHWKATAIGFLTVLVPALLFFAIGGFALDFFRGTIEILSTGRAFISGPIVIPDCFRSLSAIIWRLPDPHCLSPLLWMVTVVVSAAAIARAPLRARRDDAIWCVGLWVAVAGLAWIERLHGYYEFALASFVIAALFRFRRHRAAFAAVALALALLVRPFAHLFDVATPLRLAHGLRAEGWVEFRELPRARGAMMSPDTATALGSLRRFTASKMQPQETFFDFTFAALLYYLLDRNCPIPQVGVPFYESEAAQRKVIAALQSDRSVRAALIEFPGGLSQIDGIPNRTRAPLVWQYLQRNFRPALDEKGVVIWTRR